ncbi:MAG: Bax inhibitor-1 family protein [Gammaproteobacteria bacterium]|jgi:modulator of FtsH protease|nr:Bax inhibitor-1 family protein [Gammaproteobacteria bacterium]
MTTPNPLRSVPVAGRTSSGAGYGAVATNTVLRNTYLLLSATLLFSALMAGLSMAINLPRGLSLVCSLVSMGLLWFVVPRTANSATGIWVVFAVTGLLGLGLGPVLNSYIGRFANGSQIVMTAFGLTGTIFVGLSAFAVKSGRDFSFMRGMITGGILIAFVLSIGSLVASLLGYHFQPLVLAVSAMFALLMCGVILMETSDVVNGYQTNYVLATVGLYLAIYNLFVSLLQLLGFASGDD